MPSDQRQDAALKAAREIRAVEDKNGAPSTDGGRAFLIRSVYAERDARIVALLKDALRIKARSITEAKVRAALAAMEE